MNDAQMAIELEFWEVLHEWRDTISDERLEWLENRIGELLVLLASAAPARGRLPQLRALIAEHDRFATPPAEAVRQQDKMEVFAGIVELAKLAHSHWDADRNMKVGSILQALAGWNKGYDYRADNLHAAIWAASPDRKGVAP